MSKECSCSRRVEVGSRKETYTHAEGTTKVAECDPRAGISRVIHYVYVCLLRDAKGGREKRALDGEDESFGGPSGFEWSWGR